MDTRSSIYKKTKHLNIGTIVKIPETFFETAGDRVGKIVATNNDLVTVSLNGYRQSFRRTDAIAFQVLKKSNFSSYGERQHMKDIEAALDQERKT